MIFHPRMSVWAYLAFSLSIAYCLSCAVDEASENGTNKESDSSTDLDEEADVDQDPVATHHQLRQAQQQKGGHFQVPVKALLHQ